MNIESLLKESGIIEMISACHEKNILAKWYIFGSVARGSEEASDIDILCVVPASDSIEETYNVCHGFLLRSPTDLRVLSSKNEKSLNFIKRTSAVPIVWNPIIQ